MIAPKSNDLGLLVVVVLRRRRPLEDSTAAPHCIADKASKSINDNRCIMYTWIICFVCQLVVVKSLFNLLCCSYDMPLLIFVVASSIEDEDE